MERGTDRANRTLKRIAATLGVPIETLFSGEDDHPSMEEIDALIRSFRAISDPELRRRCLAQVVAAASASGEVVGPGKV